MPQRIVLRAVVSRIWSLYRAEAAVLLPAALVLFAVQLVIALIVPTALTLVLLVLFWVLSLLYQGFVVEVVAQARAGARVTAQGDLVRAVTPALGSLLLISLLFTIGVAIGLVLIIVPGLVLITLWSVVVPVEVLERRGVLGSFGRSRELVRGNGWNVFGVIVLVYVAVLVISLLVAVLAAPLGHVGRDLVQWAVNVVVTPLVALSASVLYFELIDAHHQIA
jgi:ABC-type multidrug transport system fused ATPase/permease subunit